MLHASGWMKIAAFVKCMQHFIKYPNSIREKQALLLRYNYTWNLSIVAIKFALEKVIVMLIFPQHCLLNKPLDASVYVPFNVYYSTEWIGCEISVSEKVLYIRHIPVLVCKALHQALTPKNIKSSFSTTGISPVNQSAFFDSDFD